MEKLTPDQLKKISISVVSHQQINLIGDLLHDIDEHCRSSSIELILTLNTAENPQFSAENFSFPIKVIRNSEPLGFASNHNKAFTHRTGEYFCVMNPDIRLSRDPFPELIECLGDNSVGVVAPAILDENGAMEDSARRFPTPFRILCKALGGCQGGDYGMTGKVIHPDWVGGMFMLFKGKVYERMGGFDERYFLYYEDVDLCARMKLSGYSAALCPDASVIHIARRSSHSSFRYMKWHLVSMLRFFLSASFLKLCCRRTVNASR